MDLSNYIQPVHFRELHLLPRVIFSIGAVLFVGSFFVKSLLLGLCGIAAIFVGSLYNLMIDTILEWVKQKRPNYVMISHCVIATLLAVGAIYFACHVERNAELLK